MRSVIFSLIKTEEIIRSLSCKNPFCAIVKGLRLFKASEEQIPTALSVETKNGKLPQKRQFTPVLHRKRHTRRSFIRSFCVCPYGAPRRIPAFAIAKPGGAHFVYLRTFAPLVQLLVIVLCAQNTPAFGRGYSGAPRRIRTFDLPVRSRALYPLS